MERERHARAISFAFTALVVAGSLALLVASLLRTTDFDFDESNTLRISAQSVPDIFGILRLEQNFPLYYLVTHGLLQLGVAAIKVFNFTCWLGTVYLARKILRFYFERALALGLLVLCFASIPYLFRYGFFLRMYGVLDLAIAAQIYLLLESQAAGIRPRALLRVATLACTLLHPIGIVVSIAMTVVECVIRKQLRPLAFGALNLLAFAAMLWMKSDVHRIYLGTGVDYIHTLGVGLAFNGPAYYETAIYNLKEGFLGWYEYVIFIVCQFTALYAFLTLRLYREPRYLVLWIPAGCFVGVPILLSGSFADHHTACFLVPFSLLLLTCLGESARVDSLGKYATLALAVLFAIVSFGTPKLGHAFFRITVANAALFLAIIAAVALLALVPRPVVRTPRVLLAYAVPFLAIAFATHVKLVGSQVRLSLIIAAHQDDACESLGRLSSDDAVLTTFTFYNPITACAGEARPRIFLLENRSIFDTSALSPTEMLEEQARRGGIIDAPSSFVSFLETTPGIFDAAIAARPRHVVLYYPFSGCTWGPALGSLAIRGYRFDRCDDPGIFVFQHG